MYADSTYIFTAQEYQEYRHEKNEIFRGRYLLRDDSIIFFPFHFYYIGAETAVVNNNFIEFLGGKTPFKMKIMKTSLKAEHRIDTLKFDDYSFFTYDSNFYKNLFPRESIPDHLNSEDLVKIDSVLSSCIRKANLTFELSNYFKQCVAVKNSKDEREVWINLLCKGEHFRDLHYYIVHTNDGGDCYFNVKINLDRLEYYDFYVNGHA